MLGNLQGISKLIIPKLLLGLDRREFLLFACLLNVPDSLLNIKTVSVIEFMYSQARFKKN